MQDYDEYKYRELGRPPNESLYEFAKQGRISLVKLAIKKGADDWDGGMYGAAQGGHLDLVKFFIEKGADIGMEVCMEQLKAVINA